MSYVPFYIVLYVGSFFCPMKVFFLKLLQYGMVRHTYRTITYRFISDTHRYGTVLYRTVPFRLNTSTQITWHSRVESRERVWYIHSIISSWTAYYRQSTLEPRVKISVKRRSVEIRLQSPGDLFKSLHTFQEFTTKQFALRIRTYYGMVNDWTTIETIKKNFRNESAPKVEELTGRVNTCLELTYLILNFQFYYLVMTRLSRLFSFLCSSFLFQASMKNSSKIIFSTYLRLLMLIKICWVQFFENDPFNANLKCNSSLNP